MLSILECVGRSVNDYFLLMKGQPRENPGGNEEGRGKRRGGGG